MKTRRRKRSGWRAQHGAHAIDLNHVDADGVGGHARDLTGGPVVRAGGGRGGRGWRGSLLAWCGDRCDTGASPGHRREDRDERAHHRGQAIAAEVRAEVAAEVARIVAAGRPRPHLTAVLVGDDPASATYVRGKHRDCVEVGLSSEVIHLPADTSQDDLLTWSRG